ncbi:uncharacterized protein LOC129694847 [Leucoraja erinacea]|uniref:uncharacterized protein LOC129694847 n=1 Tax=Leucoraja erinaceus TaxID=7782 RepID=UPI002458D620|nr:uncharacterized protein LOC129694847 [Leucoraja erinacea]
MRERALVSCTNPMSRSSRQLTTVQLLVHSQWHSLEALVDSGADENFTGIRLTDELKLEREQLQDPLEASALDGRLLYKVIHRTQPVQLIVAGNHIETISFYLLDCPPHPLVLGRPWLSYHNPHMNWGTGEIISWGNNYKLIYLHDSSPESMKDPSRSSLLGSSRTTFQQPPRSREGGFPDLTKVPSCSTRPRPLLFRHIDRTTAASTFCQVQRLLRGISTPCRHVSGSPWRNTLTTPLLLGSSDLPLHLQELDSSLWIRRMVHFGPALTTEDSMTLLLKNRYPLPLISSAFEVLKDAKVFTKLDLRNAYHLVRIREGDEWKTAFNTPSGHYEYLVMPFGLTNAPAVFQGMVNDVLRDMLNRFVFVYLDDILIFSPDETSHVQHVHQVLERLLLNDLFVKAEKCEFHANTVQFLGYVVSPAGIQMDPSKVSAVANWPTPSSRKRLQGFLGFANFYRKFIRNFSVTAAPFHALTSPHVPFSCSSQAETAFMRLKRSFSSAPILVHPDPSLQFMVEVDASGVGIGAVFSQKSPTDGRLHPCAFLS